MVVEDARAIVAALADPETLLVFGALAVGTSTLPARGAGGGTSYLTPFGLMKQTGLSREAVETATARLKRVGLLDVIVDDERKYETWRISEASLAAVAKGSKSAPGESSHP
jgi:hypothetical protein